MVKKIKNNIKNIFKESEEITLNKINSLVTALRNKMKDINKKTVKRQNKMNFFNLFLFLVYMNGTKKSCNSVVENFISRNIFSSLDPSTISKKRSKYDPLYFKEMVDTIDSIFIEKRKPSIIATDGSYMALNKKFVKYGFKKSDNNMYSTTLINSLYDVNNQKIIDLSICKHENERIAFIEQINNLIEGDIVIADRGYNSEEVICNLIKNKIDFVIRYPYNNLFFKDLKLDEDRIIEKEIKTNGETIKMKIKVHRYDFHKVEYLNEKQKKNKKEDNSKIKYTEKPLSDQYFIVTSLIDASIESIKSLYWKRWNIETNFNFIKHTLNLKNPKACTENNFKQDIYIHQFICSLMSFINNLFNVDPNYQINKTSQVEILLNFLIFHILTDKDKPLDKATIKKLLIQIYATQFKTRENRSLDRIKKSPDGKWTFYGNRYGTKKNKTQKEIDLEKQIKKQVREEIKIKKKEQKLKEKEKLVEERKKLKIEQKNNKKEDKRKQLFEIIKIKNKKKEEKMLNKNVK